MTVFEMASKYYPLMWDKSRLDRLKEAGRLNEEEYNILAKIDEK